MRSPASHTLRPLSSVLGFDIVELWCPNVDGVLTCDHFFHSEVVKAVVRKIFPDSAPFHPSVSPSWTAHSKRVRVVKFLFILLRY